MRTLGVAAAALFALGAWTPAASAYTCPLLIKEAESLIAKAEAAVAKASGGDKAAAERALGEAKKLVAEARRDHEGATAKLGHAEAVRKAKTAKAFAEEALVLTER